MKKLEWLTLPVALVILGAMMLIGVTLIGVPVWLVAKGYAPPALLVAPIGTILGSIASGITMYAKGKYEIPPYLNDAAVAEALRTVPPPAPVEHEDSIPVTTVSSRPPRAP